MLQVMKPKNLKCPFTWQQRHACFEDRVLYVPEYYDKHHLWGKIDFASLQYFGNSRPIHVEFCAGNGLWILEKALAFPEINWIAVEMRFDRVRKIWAKIQNYSLKNLIVVCGKAEDFIDHYVDINTFSHVFVNFPDPWPKDKHAKNRIIKEPFVRSLSSVCRPDAFATLATDDETYSMQMINEMSGSNQWKSCFEDPYFLTEWPEYGSSYFSDLFKEKGKLLRYMQYLNKKLPL